MRLPLETSVKRVAPESSSAEFMLQVISCYELRIHDTSYGLQVAVTSDYAYTTGS